MRNNESNLICLFEMRGGCEADPVYEITTLVLTRTIIHLSPAAGKTFTIETEDDPETDRYIQAAELNGAPLNRCWFPHSDLEIGGTLKLILGPEPNKKWGSAPEDAPPSMSDEKGKLDR